MSSSSYHASLRRARLPTVPSGSGVINSSDLLVVELDGTPLAPATTVLTTAGEWSAVLPMEIPAETPVLLGGTVLDASGRPATTATTAEPLARLPLDT